MARKKKCPEFENHERWLVAFADMMTLLFALFVVLYAIAMVNTSKIKEVAKSLKIEFGVITDTPPKEILKPEQGQGSAPDRIIRLIKDQFTREEIISRLRQNRSLFLAAEARRIEQTLFLKLAPIMKKNLAFNRQSISVAKDSEGVRITLLSGVLFKSGEFALQPQTKELLDNLADVLASTKKVIRVEGHTDNIPFERQGMTNWELSALRATAVVRYLLTTQKFHQGTLYAAEFADTYPLVENSTAENRAINRRVDFKILYNSTEDFIRPDGQVPPS